MVVFDMVSEEFTSLLKKNQELKKQVKDKTEDYKRMKDNFDSKVDTLNKIENQQKEFIKYLEDEIKRLKENDIYQSLQKMALATHEHILQKYKEIIGGKDEKEN